MAVHTVAIISPGEMGCAVGSVLKDNGLNIIASLSGRSELTRDRAVAAGFQDAPSLEGLLGEADLVLSIVPPDVAVDMAREVASVMRSSGFSPAYVDCNAISPNSCRRAGDLITEAGAVFIDGGIIGTPPWKEILPRIYVSGERTDLVMELDGKGISIKPIGNEIGRASALKFFSASLTKGTLALQTGVMIAAEALGLTEDFHRELLIDREDLYRRIENGTRRLPSVSARYMGEMKEIAETFSSAGVTPKFFEGALDVYRLLAKTPLASETPDTIDTGRTLGEAARLFAKHLPMIQ